MSDGLNREGFTGPPGRAHEVGDRVRVTGTVIGTNHRSDWVSIDAGGSIFSFGGVSTSSNIERADDEQPQPAPDLGAAYADLESEIRETTVQIAQCRSGGLPCGFCERQITHAMKAIDAYARDVARHERTREQPAPELAAAMAETRELRDLLGEILRTFGDSSGDGWRSRVGQVKYRQWRERAGLPK